MNRQAAVVAASLRSAFVVVATMLIAACATTDTSVVDVSSSATTAVAATNEPPASVPAACPQGDFVRVVQAYVAGAYWVDTPWDPAPGTDLAATLAGGGVACTYGIEVAEVGTTVLWAPGAELFDARRAEWEEAGFVSVAVDGADDAVALLGEGSEMGQVWIVNLKVDDVWIQINASFLRDLDAARALSAGALDATRTN